MLLGEGGLLFLVFLLCILRRFVSIFGMRRVLVVLGGSIFFRLGVRFLL